MLTIFRDVLTRSDAQAGEVGSEDCSWLENWDGDGDKFSVFKMGFDSFYLEFSGLGESDREDSAGDEESAESHEEGKWWKWK